MNLSPITKAQKHAELAENQLHFCEQISENAEPTPENLDIVSIAIQQAHAHAALALVYATMAGQS